MLLYRINRKIVKVLRVAQVLAMRRAMKASNAGNYQFWDDLAYTFKDLAEHRAQQAEKYACLWLQDQDQKIADDYDVWYQRREAAELDLDEAYDESQTRYKDLDAIRHRISTEVL